MKSEVIEIKDFAMTPESFQRLKAELKAGKIVRNPFARLYGEGDVKVIKKTTDE